MVADFKIHSGWGDHIEWLRPEQFNLGFDGIEFDVHGHLRKIPNVGDTLVGEFKRSFVKFKFVSVRRMSDPQDQFFGKVVAIEQEMKE